MPKPLAAFALSVALVALMLAAPALAQQGPSEAAMHWFDSFDQDKDGVMTPEETSSVGAKQFGRIDASGDGALSVDEYVFGIPESRAQELERARARFRIMDRDGSGSASQDEFVGFGLRVIELADADADGRLSRAEFAESVTPSQ